MTVLAVALEIADPWAVAASSVTWLTVSVVVGWWANRWPADRLDRPGPLTTLRGWERGGAFWQRTLRVSRWKDRTPEAGALFASGHSKRHLRARSTEGLVHFRRETIRAERVHWLILASTPIHLLWCRPTVAAGMVVFGLVANLPFIVIQRFNRGRLVRLIARRAR